MTSIYDVTLDALVDNILERVSEIQCHAAAVEAGKPVDPHRLYMDACEIEFCMDIFRVMREEHKP